MSKSERREIAVKKAKRKKIIITSVCSLLAIFIIGAIIYAATRPEVESRLYSSGTQSINLYVNGRFTFVDCQFTRAGVYTEIADGDDIKVEFVHRNVTVYGTLSGDILTIPDEWDSGKGHDPRLRLQ